MFSRSPLGRRPVAAGSILALLAAAATTAAVAVPTGAAATGETEYTSNFNASCVIGPGILNARFQFAISTTAKGPSTVETGTELNFREASVTLTGPVETTEALRYVGSNHVKGTVDRFPALVANGSPAELNLATSASVPEGSSFESPLEAGHLLTIRIPSGAQSTSWGPVTATGKAGQSLTLTASTAPGFEETEPDAYRATGEGIVIAISGYNAEGTKVIGPLKLVCNAPEHVTFASVPIEGVEGGGTGGTGTTGPVKERCTTTTPRPNSVVPDEGPSSGGTTVTIHAEGGAVSSVRFGSIAVPFTVTANGIVAVTPPGTGTVLVVLEQAPSCGNGAAASFHYISVVEKPTFKNWTLAGSITPKPLGQAIALPAGSAFNGSGELNSETGAGSVTGSISVPPFKAAVKLYGLIPVSLGMTVSQSGSITGTVAKSTTVPGDETLTLPVKLNLGFTSLGLLGLNIPTSCSTSQPISLTLTDTLSKGALLSKGWAFSGTTTIPKLSCSGGLLGKLYGETINGLIAGAGSSYSLTVSAPGG